MPKAVLYTAGRAPSEAETEKARSTGATIATTQLFDRPAPADVALVPEGEGRFADVAKACKEAGQEVKRFDAKLWAGYQPGSSATDGARKLAFREGFDLASLEPKGSDGDVLKSQVEKALAGDSTDDSSETEDEE